jgi:putative phage-type endonuclease
MTAVLVTDAAPNTEEWHAARRNGIGASEISAVVGLNPWESPFSLWAKKKGLIPGADPENPLFYWGHALEPLVAARFAESRPDLYVAHVGTHRHSEREWQYANLDRLVLTADGRDVPLEIKTTRYPDDWGQTGTDQIPLHVRCQVLQQMDVFSAPYALVAVLIGGSDYREYRIDYDEADATALREAGAAFWASLQTDEEPPIDASFATYEAVRDLHPEINGEDVDVNPALYARYATSKADADSATSAHRQAKSELLAAMGQARRALVNGAPVLRRQPGRGGSVSLYPITQKETAA